MPVLKINLPYNIPNAKESPQESTVNLIITGVNSKNPNGLQGTNRRVFARIQFKFDEAIEKKLDTVDLEVAEFELVKQSVKEGTYPAVLSKYVSLLENEIDASEKTIA